MSNRPTSPLPVCGVADIYRLVVEAAPHAIVLTGAQGQIVLVNARAERLFGYTREEMVGQPVETLLPERFRTAHRDHRSEYGKDAEVRLLGRGRELFARRKDGSEVRVEIGLDPIETPEGLLVLSTIIDIAERVRAETAMRASELRYRRLFESAQDGILILDAETGMVVDVNPFLETLLGYSHEQFMGKALWELGFFRDVVANEDKFAELRETKYARYEDLPLETSDGRRIEVEFVSNVYLVNGGKVIQCNIRDIIERKRSEREALISKTRFAAVFRSNLAAIGIHTVLEDRVVEVNERMCEFSGWKREEVIGKNIFELEVWVDVAQRDAVMEQVRTTGCARDVEVRLRCRSGEVRDVLLSTERLDVPGEAEPVVVTMFTDFTERKKAEAALQESEERARLVVQASNIGLWDWNLVTNEVFFSAEWKGQLGYADAELPNRFEEWESRLHPADREAVLAAVKDYLEGRRATYDVEFRLRHKDGSWRWSLTRAKMVRDETGKPVRIMGCHIDITERKHAAERFRRLVDSNAQGVLFFRASGEITDANDAFLRMVGYSREDLEAGRLNWEAMTPPEYVERCRHCMEEIAARGFCAPYEKEYFRKDGSRVPLLLGAAGFEDNPEEGVAFAVDLTERKKLEQQFLRSQRMESIGTLAGGIAHDLNNVLAPIMMAIEVMKMRLPDPDSQELLSILSSSAQRGSDMVRQVLSFARGVEGRRMEVQIRHLIRDIEKMANDTFLKNIQVRTVIQNGLWTVMGDPTQLHQVLLNLCVNARDAMPDGGKLVISARNLTLDAQYSGMNSEAKPGPYVFIQVEDTGSGMPPGVIEKIFDPFFTTKEVGNGTGLGLSTTLAIVKSHGGFIQVYSEPGKGTTFKVHLPAQTEASVETAAEIAAELPRGHGELILVVDDEAGVRQVTQHTLEAFGYRVVLASDGAEAVAIYATRRKEIAVVLTDMTMPVMDGLTTIQVLRKVNPGVCIIAASGLSANTQFATLGVKHFLPKPYTAETLLKVLKEVLSPA